MNHRHCGPGVDTRTPCAPNDKDAANGASAPPSRYRTVRGRLHAVAVQVRVFSNGTLDDATRTRFTTITLFGRDNSGHSGHSGHWVSQRIIRLSVIASTLFVLCLHLDRDPSTSTPHLCRSGTAPQNATAGLRGGPSYVILAPSE